MTVLLSSDLLTNEERADIRDLGILTFSRHPGA
jgi:hypothetical protein